MSPSGTLRFQATVGLQRPGASQLVEGMLVTLILFVYGDSLEAQAKKLAAENAQIAKEHQELRAAGLVGFAGR